MKRKTKIAILTVTVLAAISIPIWAQAKPDNWPLLFVSQSQYKELPADKQADIDKEVKIKEDALSGVIPQADPAKEAAIGPVTIEAAAPQPGFQPPEAPPGIKDFKRGNIWAGKFDTTELRLYAGVYVQDGQINENQGMIVVQEVDTTDGTMKLDELLTPGQNGAVTITKVEGHTAYLTAQDGTVIPFDLLNHKFE